MKQQSAPEIKWLHSKPLKKIQNKGIQKNILQKYSNNHPPYKDLNPEATLIIKNRQANQIQEHTAKWGSSTSLLQRPNTNSMCSWITRVSAVNLVIRPKLVYRSKAISYQNLRALFVWKLICWILTFTWKSEDLRLAKRILKKKYRVWRLIPLNLKLNHKATIIKTDWCWHKDQHTDDQQETTEKTETNFYFFVTVKK